MISTLLSASRSRLRLCPYRPCAFFLAITFCTFFTGCSDSSDISGTEHPDENQACSNYNELRSPHFGDTHVHTMYSFDSFAFDVRLTPEDAFRFAKGEEVGITPYNELGEPMRSARLESPLDWAMLSDHSELFGETTICTNPAFTEYQDLNCVIYRLQNDLTFNTWASRFNAGQDEVERFEFCGEDGVLCLEQSAQIMQEHIVAAENANDMSEDCGFTAFIGYEWSGHPRLEATGGGLQNIHRNVLFANGKVPARPISYLDAPYPEDLWTRLTTDCLEGIPGCDVLTIPHNSNLSAGLMFQQRDKNDQPLNAEYARMRARFEPIIEIFQHKGASECIAGGSDPQCDFEFLPWGDLLTGFVVAAGGPWSPGAPRHNAFVRSALSEGLALQDSLGENPFKFGFVGGTDTHMGTPGMVEERNFPGHLGGRLTDNAFRHDLTKKQFSDDPHNNPGGLSVVWAEENTRESLFAAMRRREVYATSGPRHVLRFFGGWEYEQNLCSSAVPVQTGYDRGVPMGSDLPLRGIGQSPSFLVIAMKDSVENAVDLQNIQIIKGWVEDTGERRERVFDVAGTPVNGTDVGLENCTPTGSGHDNLCAVWVDPDFNAQHNAFYYARVLESRSCRWTSFQCLDQEINCDDPDSAPLEMRRVCCDGKSPSELPELKDHLIPNTLQERSWSSPIWYTPST